jgi:predicted Ser/Thr protein kinase
MFGGCILLRELGRGGMGMVFLARRGNDPRPVALKVLLNPLQPTLVQRFLRETQALERLHDPGIVPLIASGVERELPYLVMEYVQGVTLAAVLENPAATPEDRVRILARLARAVAHAHENGVIHRDLKPSNVIVRPDRTPMILDFGLARLSDADERLTRSGVMVGTPAYMAPEQIAAKDATAATDIFALGVLLYEALEDELPFDGGDLITIYAAIERGPPRGSRIDARLLPTVQRALAKDPEQRHATALDLAHELEAWLAGETPSSARTAAARLAAGGPGRRWGRLLGGAAGLVAVSAGVLVALAMRAPSPPVSAPAGHVEPAPAMRPTSAASDAPAKRAAPVASADPDLPEGAPVSHPGPAPEPVAGSPHAPSEGGAAGVSERKKALLAAATRMRHVGDVAGAVAELTKAIELDPLDASSWTARAGARVLQNDMPGALADANKAIALAPADAEAWRDEARARYGIGDPRGAMADMEHALSLDRTSPWAWSVLGRWREKQGDLKGALAALDEAVRLYHEGPKLALALKTRGDVKLSLADAAGALADYKAALDADPGAKNTKELGEKIAALEAK